MDFTFIIENYIAWLVRTGFSALFDIIENYCTLNTLCSLSKAEIFSVFFCFSNCMSLVPMIS